MAKFLNTSATNYYLEELIKSASDRLILISPYLKLNDRIKELLEDKNRLKIDVRIVYGKSELKLDEINWLRELDFIRTSFCKNLHAKCYINEESAIITSLNLYEFSQINNNEMGVHCSRQDDPELYRDAYEEAQRIIRVSEEVRISLEKVTPRKARPIGQNTAIIDEAKTPEEKPAIEESAEEIRLSSSKMAKRNGVKTGEFLEKMAELGLIQKIDDDYSITQAGADAGVELKPSRFGAYMEWPALTPNTQNGADKPAKDSI